MLPGTLAINSDYCRFIATSPPPSRTFRPLMQPNKAWKRKATRLATAMVALALLFLGVGDEGTSAHKLVTSKYDFSRDAFPLLRDHCAACHVPGGPAPMSLVTYDAAVPWAQSIREELTAGRMPPWPVDPSSPAIKG